jgi:hypothetical protein
MRYMSHIGLIEVGKGFFVLIIGVGACRFIRRHQMVVSVLRASGLPVSRQLLR